MRARWAWDLEGGGATCPFSLDGVIVMSMKLPPGTYRSGNLIEGIEQTYQPRLGHFMGDGMAHLVQQDESDV